MIEWHVSRRCEGDKWVYETQVWKYRADGFWVKLNNDASQLVNPNDKTKDQRVVEWAGVIPKPARKGCPPRQCW